MTEDVKYDIEFTEAAAAQVKRLMEEESVEQEIVALRAFIQGGGCSGFQYGFTFEDSINEDDLVIENNGIKLIVDPLSAQYMVGAKIDFKSDLYGSQFVITNPNATTTCGCGSSFGV